MDIEKRITSLLGESANKGILIRELDRYLNMIEDAKNDVKRGRDPFNTMGKLISEIRNFKWEDTKSRSDDFLDDKDFDYDNLRVRRLGR